MEDVLLNRQFDFLEERKFQILCQKEVHSPSLFHFLVGLLAHPSFLPFLQKLTSPDFLHHIFRELYFHTESNRCKVYQAFLKIRVFDRDIRFTDLPWRCWTCLSWLVRQKDFSTKYARTFTNGIIRFDILHALSRKKEIIDILVSLMLANKLHAARLLFDKFCRLLLNGDEPVEFLIELYAQPALIHKVFTQDVHELIPSRDREDIEKRMKKGVLQHVRKRNWVFKEDLMIKTWHPDRLFPWCLDIEELKDFEPL